MGKHKGGRTALGSHGYEKGKWGFRGLVGLAACCICLAICLPALGDMTILGDRIYVYPETMDQAPTFTLTVTGKGLDPVTLAPTLTPHLPGAVFSVHARSGGAYVPFPDPADPTRPLTLVSVEGEPLSVALPLSVDLFLKQEEAPPGYRLGDEEGVYHPLSLPGSLTITNPAEGMQGLHITLLGQGGIKPHPLAGIPFTLVGGGETKSLLTDEQGMVIVPYLVPGEYTLTQDGEAEGYHGGAESLTIAIKADEVSQITLSNYLDGQLVVRTLGIAADGGSDNRLIPLSRRYAVLDPSGEEIATVASGEAIPLPAHEEGARYTLRSLDLPEDGFAKDGETHDIIIYPGQMTQYQTVVESLLGFFTFSHQSQAGGPVAGGSFVLLSEDGQVAHAFTAGDDGAYTPDGPILSGVYTLAMTHAGEGHRYDGHTLPVTITPAKGEDSYAEIIYESQPIPLGLLTPTVTAEVQHLPSLFASHGEVEVALSLGDPSLRVEDLAFDIQVPAMEGLSYEDIGMDGGLIRIQRRFALPGTPEVKEIQLTGTVRYTIEIPIADQETERREISAPFSVTVAAFEAYTPPAYALVGHVVDGKGDPAAGIPVSLEDGEGRILRETVTDPFGAYAFEVLPDGAKAYIHPAEGFGILHEEGVSRILPLETVTGRVISHGGLLGNPVLLSIGHLEAISPGEDGTFAFVGAAIGDKPLLIQVPDGVLSQVSLEDGAYAVHLYQAATLHGQVTDPAGAPIPDATITLTAQEGQGEGEYGAITDAKGQYEIGSLFPGSYAYAFTPPEGMIRCDGGEGNLNLAAGERASLSTSMMRPATIRGSLDLGRGPSPQGILVTLKPGDLPMETDASGGFLFTGLSLGMYTLEVALPGGMVFLAEPEPIHIQASGQEADILLAAVAPVTLSGIVWNDENDDGFRGPEESGLAQAVATLYDQGMAILETQTTGPEGTYAFLDLLPGTYHVGIVLPEGMIYAKHAPGTERLFSDIEGREAISQPMALSSGDTPGLLSCGGTQPGTVSGFAFEDKDGDGFLDPSQDTPFAGIAITLLRDGEVHRETVTDETGAYAFDQLRMGDYRLRMVLPEGYLFTRTSLGEGIKSDMPPVDGTVAETDVAIRSWRPHAPVNGGIEQVATLSAFIWLDGDADGNYWNEQGLPGAPLSLYVHENGRDTLALQGETDEGGAYAFPALRPGTYRIDCALPKAEWGVSAGEGSQIITLKSGSVHTYEAGVSRLGEIRGMVFGDQNYDGYRDDLEPGLSATIALVDPATGDILAETIAKRDGTYAFTELLGGRYVLRFTLPDGHVFTKHQTDDPTYNSDVPETRGNTADTATLFLPMGEALHVDAGGYQPGILMGSAWHDLAGSGLYAPENPAIPGLAIALYREGEQVMEAVTGEGGQYRFEAVPPGTYTIRTTLPQELRFTAMAEGGKVRGSTILPAEGLMGETGPLALQMGKALTDVDIGVIRLGGLQGVVRNALTKAPLSGSSLTFAGEGMQAQTVTTDGEGRYRLENLRPGTLTATFAPPEGFVMAQGEEPSFTVSVRQGEVAAPEDVRFLPEAILEGILWLDEDGDHTLGQGEKPLTGIDVTLLLQEGDEETTLATLKTDERGTFRFGSLTPNTYSLLLALPKGTSCYDGAAPDPVALSMGQRETLAIGAFAGATLTGKVFEDLSHDGIRDAGEPPIPGLTISLMDREGDILAQAITDEAGVYRFEDLPPLSGSLSPDVDGRYLPGLLAPGTIALTMGETLRDVDMGLLRRGRIGDMVWLDENGNGLLDSGEPGIPGIHITLYRILDSGDPAYLADTITDDLGYYRFDEIMPGRYEMTFDVRDYLPTKPLDAPKELTSKLPFVARQSLSTGAFFLGSGQHLITMDGGLVTKEMSSAFGWTVDGSFAIREHGAGDMGQSF